MVRHSKTEFFVYCAICLTLWTTLSSGIFGNSRLTFYYKKTYILLSVELFFLGELAPLLLSLQKKVLCVDQVGRKGISFDFASLKPPSSGDDIHPPSRIFKDGSPHHAPMLSSVVAVSVSSSPSTVRTDSLRSQREPSSASRSSSVDRSKSSFFSRMADKSAGFPVEPVSDDSSSGVFPETLREKVVLFTKYLYFKQQVD